MAIITTANASNRPENALAGTGSNDSRSAASTGLVTDGLPMREFPRREAPELRLPLLRRSVLLPSVLLLSALRREAVFGASWLWLLTAGPSDDCLWGPPKSALMTSPPTDASCFRAAGVALGTLGRRVAMTLL
jgi:hypothetical protein